MTTPTPDATPSQRPDNSTGTAVGSGLGADEFAFTARVPVRWSDMDAFGHINHARMITLMEEARIQWLLSAGDEYAPLITSAMIVHVEIRYQAQLRHDDSPLQIGMWIKRFRSVDFTIGYEIRGSAATPASKPACIASTQMAVVDVEAHTLRRLSPMEKDHLRTWSR
ncbi:thioesterase family protein [Gordonia sp. NB41Y]|uniref:acyl-CoA thioesterase n=1 Tax=Gordonia sp. NB41Y TaxID=875808 RepID=UPI0006B21B12|nr:thioesterase family protein [Gordonia sp. NB41Y]KOY49682.1 thioesterase [Gordonia sp. NB41Y]WLP92694.1 thioesterase family protein [Gordonia sp. NB41Y]